MYSLEIVLIPTSAALQESLVETWFVNRQDVVISQAKIPTARPNKPYRAAGA